MYCTIDFPRILNNSNNTETAATNQLINTYLLQKHLIISGKKSLEMACFHVLDPDPKKMNPNSNPVSQNNACFDRPVIRELADSFASI
jgi:hypothetical protein